MENTLDKTKRVELKGLETELFEAQEMLQAVMFLMNNGDNSDDRGSLWGGIRGIVESAIKRIEEITDRI